MRTHPGTNLREGYKQGQPYTTGYNDGADNKPNTNPYKPGTHEHTENNKGHRDGQEDRDTYGPPTA